MSYKQKTAIMWIEDVNAHYRGTEAALSRLIEYLQLLGFDRFVVFPPDQPSDPQPLKDTNEH